MSVELVPKNRNVKKEKKESSSAYFGSCLILPGPSQLPHGNLQFNSVSFMFSLYGFRVNSSCSRAVSNAVKSLSLVHSTGDAHSLSWMKVTLDSRLSLPVVWVGWGRQGEMLTGDNNGVSYLTVSYRANFTTLTKKSMRALIFWSNSDNSYINWRWSRLYC